MAGILVIAAASAASASEGDEKAAVGEKHDHFRCEVILPQREWAVPVNASSPTKLELALRITNTGTDDLLVGRYMALHIVFRDGTGRVLESGGYADGMRGPRTADYRVLSPGDSTTFRIETALGLTEDGNMILGGPDGHGAYWAVYPKGRGAYGIQVKYRFTPEDEFRIPGPTGTSIPVSPRHLAPIKFTSEILAVTIGAEKHENAADQPASRSESTPKGEERPKPETEGRPR